MDREEFLNKVEQIHLEKERIINEATAKYLALKARAYSDAERKIKQLEKEYMGGLESK